MYTKRNALIKINRFIIAAIQQTTHKDCYNLLNFEFDKFEQDEEEDKRQEHKRN